MRLAFFKLKARLSGNDGETLVETLVSVLIIAVVMLMLCTAIVTAAKINATARGINASYDATSSTGIEVTVEVSHGSQTDTYTSSTTGLKITGRTQNGYVSYEASK